MRFAVPAAACAAWTVLAGKDLNWDLLHYHLYLPYALFGARLSLDYFAAGPQSYLNPLGYVPFYLAVSSGLHSVVVSMLFAAAHGMSIAFLYLIARDLGAQRFLAILAAALGAASAVFLATVGTSFLDPLLAVPMLAAIWLLVRAPARGGWAGVLFGIAAALKYSNAFFALAALVLIRDRRTLLAYIAGGAAAVALLALPWMVVLYREFGNPVFPHLNSIFRSPDFPAISLGAERFAPRDLGAALAFPFQLASPEFMTYAEIAAPDLRFSVLMLALVALAIAAARRRHVPDVRFLAFFLIAMGVWIATSGNGRYGMLILLVLGPVLAHALQAAVGERAARMALPVVLVAQVTAIAMISPPRWFMAESWTSQWFPFVVPERGPALYFTMEAQTMSAVVPYLHPQSSFVNLRGQHSVAPGWKRVEALLARHGGKARALGRGLRLQADGLPRPEVVAAYDQTMLRFGFRLDTSDCYAIGWEGEMGRLLSLASCALVPGERDPRDIAAEARMSRVFDRIERECRRLFRGHTAITEPLGEEWSRTYAGLEARLETHSGRVVLAPFFRLVYYDLGLAADWEGPGAPPQPPACRDAS